MRPTTEEVCLDAGKSACFRASALPTDCFDCQARPAMRDLLLAKTPERAILVETLGNPA
jgi:hypothetical protein